MGTVLTPATWDSLWTCFVLALATSSISVSITQGELFAPLRNWAQKVGHMTGHLFQCFFCISHWVVFLGIAIFRPTITSSGLVLVDWIVAAFFSLTLSTLVSGLMFKVLLTGMAKKVRDKELKEMFAPK
ncbi:DUF1360 domain-containing protein [Pseudomonas aeruginosa]|jgi:hypothetical protein|uniref:DUF1360 domain-containing protein n=2 Tax=Pseudomonas fluorescens group TaxID=136843 RepID=A0A8I1E1H4_9PSED|nr:MULTISPECIES: DUF1360 domain-containing protein [Pseudomonas]ERU44202.1 hypothetical protein Q092_01175 [Pseudomonas aeruginosa CF77]KFJ91409.1 hypothetical protein JF55_13450 [Pseudomonas sp. 1-7]KIL05104.1 hypothetical protein QX25_08635 [Stutzerimonas stutzeri]MPS43533.1 DUF1360 domain-containing protein [Stenotrophomonas sp.]EKX3739226.1 DUF1360 domain-containing protein [Pseudomonas aeruginosa]